MDIEWDVLTIGHLSRNRYWGEADDRSYREPRCTCTLLRTSERTIVVDPALEPDGMREILDQRAGIGPDEVDTVFLTHFHGDHRYGLAAFPGADWIMAPAEIAYWQTRYDEHSAEREHLNKIVPSSAELLSEIRVVDTPGHTFTHASLLFTSGGMRVAVAGDAAMTRDFFLHRDYYFNTVDVEAAVRSIDFLREQTDIIVPGHDNYFLTRLAS